jgi:hypothetical protein
VKGLLTLTLEGSMVYIPRVIGRYRPIGGHIHFLKCAKNKDIFIASNIYISICGAYTDRQLYRPIYRHAYESVGLQLADKDRPAVLHLSSPRE